MNFLNYTHMRELYINKPWFLQKPLVCDIISWSFPEKKYYSQETKVKNVGLYHLIYSPMMLKIVRFDLLWLSDDYVTQNDVCVMIDVASLLLKTLLVCIVNVLDSDLKSIWVSLFFIHNSRWNHPICILFYFINI